MVKMKQEMQDALDVLDTCCKEIRKFDIVAQKNVMVRTSVEDAWFTYQKQCVINCRKVNVSWVRIAKVMHMSTATCFHHFEKYFSQADVDDQTVVYWQEVKRKVKEFRRLGVTWDEISKSVGVDKSTLWYKYHNMPLLEEDVEKRSE
jgi:hypothetical protein